MQTICTSLQTDNQTISPFLQAGCSSLTPNQQWQSTMDCYGPSRRGNIYTVFIDFLHCIFCWCWFYWETLTMIIRHKIISPHCSCSVLAVTVIFKNILFFISFPYFSYLFIFFATVIFCSIFLVVVWVLILALEGPCIERNATFIRNLVVNKERMRRGWESVLHCCDTVGWVTRRVSGL